MPLIWKNFSKKILIYGINKQAEQLYWYLRNEGIDVEAFVVDKAYKKYSSLLGQLVYCFEDIQKEFCPQDYGILLSFGYKNMVRNRQEKYRICRELGYEVPTFIHKNAFVYTDLSNIGDSVLIYPGVVIEPFVEINKGCFIESASVIAHHTVLGEFNFLAPRVTIGGEAVIGNNCFLGLSSVVASGKRVGNMSIIGAGVCTTSDVEPNTALRHPEAYRLSKHTADYI